MKPAVTWKVEEKSKGRFYVVRSFYRQFRTIAGPFATRAEARESMKELQRSYTG